MIYEITVHLNITKIIREKKVCVNNNTKIIKEFTCILKLGIRKMYMKTRTELLNRWRLSCAQISDLNSLMNSLFMFVDSLDGCFWSDQNLSVFKSRTGDLNLSLSNHVIHRSSILLWRGHVLLHIYSQAFKLLDTYTKMNQSAVYRWFVLLSSIYRRKQ